MNKLTFPAPRKLYQVIAIALFGIVLLFASVLLLWLTRGDWIYPTQSRAATVITLGDNDQSLGQTFVAEQTGLQGVQIKVQPSSANRVVTLSLFEHPGSSTVLRRSTITIPSLEYPQWVSFSFEPVKQSRSRYYYVSFAVKQKDSIGIFYGPPDTYHDGSLYQEGEPYDGQLAFNLMYNRRAMLLDLMYGIATSIPNGVMVALAFFLPGWALLVLFQRRNSMSIHWLEGVAVSAGLSLALYPVLFLLTNTVNIRPGKYYLWGTVLAAIIVLVWHYRPWQMQLKTVEVGIKRWTHSGTFWADITLVSLLIIALGGQLLMVRGLDLPLLGDSVHHVTLTQLVMDNDRLFQSWEPYAPYETFSFHFGFHVNSAIFGWATGLDAPQAVLWGGQFFNLLAVFLIFPLAYRLKGVWAGVVAVLIAGFFTQFPSYYVNWGRYPQLMGQTVLMIAAWWTWVTLSEESISLKDRLWFIFGAMLIVGTVFGYYRMAFHYFAFVIAALLVVMRTVSDFRNWQRWVILGITALLAVLLMSSWLGSVAARLLLPAASNATQTTNPSQTISMWAQMARQLVRIPITQMMVFLLGTLGVMWWGRRAALPVVWFGMLLMLPVLKVLSLPGAGIIQQFTIETSLYMPVTLMLGVCVAFIVADWLASHWKWSSLFSVTIILLAVLRFPTLPKILDRGYSFVGKPDIIAVNWINQNLAPDSFFLINGIVYTDGVSAIGGDAGWWLPILTKRGVTIPPQYALLMEKPSIPNYSQAVNNLVKELSSILVDTRKGEDAICNFPIPITHIYLGQNRGEGDKAGVPPPRPMLPAENLLHDPAFKLIYHQDRVMIFEFDRSICTN